MMPRFALLAVPLVFALLPVPADAADEPAEQAKAAEKPLCKRTTRTGTRFATKVCRTPAQWEAIAEANRRAAADMANRPAIANCGPNGCD